MADTVKSANTVTLGFEREDGTVQYIHIIDGDTNATANDTRAVMTHLTTNQILLDSKTSNALSTTSILTSYITEGTTIQLDLTEE